MYERVHMDSFFLREIYICSNGNNNKIKEILL
nr:MAG TPA: hypothetical protein [Caudoviricetes sp.]